MNKLYKDNALVLLHRRYKLIIGGFGWEEYAKYLRDEEEPSNPGAFMKEVKFLHFSDWPIRKERLSLTYPRNR